MHWKQPCADLAAELAAACEAALRPTELRLDDLTDSMLAEEEDSQVVPYYPIGQIYRYRLRERRTRRLFGRRWLPIRRWRGLLHFGMEEMTDFPRWAESHGLWCIVEDVRVLEAVKPLVERFAAAHRLKLDFAPRAP